MSKRRVMATMQRKSGGELTRSVLVEPGDTIDDISTRAFRLAGMARVHVTKLLRVVDGKTVLFEAKEADHG